MEVKNFTNFTNKPFTCKFDGKSKIFAPGESEWMSSGKADHFAKHLANQVLTEQGKVSKCSPKRPSDVPEFMELFDKALTEQESSEETNGEEMAAVRNKKNTKKKPAKKNAAKANDDEDFEGLKTEV